MLDRADDIELVDLTPDDLIQRLKEGKVYVPKQAERALEHYFSPGNLTALRELALRRTAERVDEQLLTHMQANAIAGPMGCRRAHSGLRQRGSARGRAGPLHQAAGGSAARAVDGDLHRDAPQPAIDRRGARPACRHAAACRNAGRRCADHSGVGRRIADDVLGLRARQQRHPDRHRQVDALVVVRACARLGGARSRAARRQYQRPCHCRRRARRRAGSEEAVRTAERSEPFDAKPYAMALLLVAVALGVGAADSSLLRHRECRSCVSDRRRRRRRALWAVALAVGERRGFAVL